MPSTMPGKPAPKKTQTPLLTVHNTQCDNYRCVFIIMPPSHCAMRLRPGWQGTCHARIPTKDDVLKNGFHWASASAMIAAGDMQAVDVTHFASTPGICAGATGPPHSALSVRHAPSMPGISFTLAPSVHDSSNRMYTQSAKSHLINQFPLDQPSFTEENNTKQLAAQWLMAAQFLQVCF